MLTVFSSNKPLFCAKELSSEMSRSPHSGFLRDNTMERTDPGFQKRSWNPESSLRLEVRSGSPVPQTAVKVDVALGADLPVHCVRLTKTTAGYCEFTETLSCDHGVLLPLTPYVNSRPCGFSTAAAPLNKPWKQRKKVPQSNTCSLPSRHIDVWLRTLRVTF